jgi:hypothetical protein
MNALTTKAILLIPALVLAVASQASAALIAFDTPVNATASGQPVTAQATFTTSAGQVTVVLDDNTVNPISVVQNLSGLYFTLSTGQTAGTLSSSSAILRHVDNDGTFTDASSAASTGWLLGTAGIQLHLNVLGAPAGPAHTILGLPNPGPGTYSAANSSITNSSGPHEPFIAHAATFVLNVPGVTSDSTVSAAVFSFGTALGAADVTGVPDVEIVQAPEPATMSLLALGSGLFLVSNWRRKSAS